jgi:8-oxo-dGTP pyrophosphatase MutT (NUDIX family)/dephospho-CoA kinase
MALPELPSLTLFHYSKLRFERLVKLTRAVVLQISTGPWDQASDFLTLINVYADLLAQAFLENKYNEVSERRLLHRMQACASACVQVRARIDWMTERLAGDLNNPSEKILRRLETKKGTISFSPSEVNDWHAWLESKPIEQPDSLIGILSRALMDAALISRICGIPVRYVCHSRSRLRTVALQMLDADWIHQNHFNSTILVDSHSITGETLARCWQQLSVNTRLTGARITCDETRDTFLLPGVSQQKKTSVPWSAFVRSDPTAKKAAAAAPLVILSGFPGSGKTLLRKAIEQRTHWPAYSWSRVVRPLLKELFGDLSVTTAGLLTKEEQSDPEFIAREFLLSSHCYAQKRDIPLVIDGVKSIAAVEFLKRQLGRSAIVIRVYRSARARRQAIETRKAFDDVSDEQRIGLLNSIGLAALMESAEFSIDTSDSLFTIGATETAFIEVLKHQVMAQISSPAMSLRLNAAIVLLAPDNEEILILQSAVSKKWGLPGGFIEAGEDPWNAAKRELLEETGLLGAEIVNGYPPFFLHRSLSEDTALIGNKMTTIFVARARSRDVCLSAEHVDHIWVSSAAAIEMLSFPLNLILRRLFNSVIRRAETSR